MALARLKADVELGRAMRPGRIADPRAAVSLTGVRRWRQLQGLQGFQAVRLQATLPVLVETP